jgi:hypothetical protein
MTCMATWEDGPEYAPLERPADFDPAAVAPLSVAPPVQQMAALAPKDRPAFDQPPAPLAPLAALVPMPEETRDPQLPFAVVSSTVTSDSAWGAVHWGGASGPPQPSLPLTVPQTQPVPPDNRFPTPGTPGWFGPGPYGEQPPARAEVGAKAVWDAAMPGMCICLAVGGLVYVVAPILFAVAFGLSRSVKVARDVVRRTFVVGAGVLGLVAIVAAWTNDEGFARWWTVVGAWSMVVCWGVLLTALALVYRALSSGEQPSRPNRQTWG